MKKLNQKAFSVAEVVLIIVTLAMLVGIGLYVFNNDSAAPKPTNSSNTKTPETKIKHLGVNLDFYDEVTNKAGDFVFTKEKMAFNMLFMNFGYQIPATSAGPAKTNPQPTFILPYGTKVYSLVDGQVVDVPKLYSEDYSVMVKGEGSDLIFETEHVTNVKVKRGDEVKAGQVIAEVSDYDAKNWAGYSLVEIGVLKPGNPPQHLCPFEYLDDSIKTQTLNRITALQKSWEKYRGDKSIYNEKKAVIPGCDTLDPIEG